MSSRIFTSNKTFHTSSINYEGKFGIYQESHIVVQDDEWMKNSIYHPTIEAKATRETERSCQQDAFECRAFAFKSAHLSIRMSSLPMSNSSDLVKDFRDWVLGFVNKNSQCLRHGMIR